MSANECFGLGASAAILALLAFGLKVLPRENMQVLATIPTRRRADGRWQGVNLTWYGVMQAVAMVVAVTLALALALAVQVPLAEMVLILLVLLAAALPSARIVARVVEKRSGTFTVGGAIFVATMLLPPVALAADACFGTDRALAILAALAVAYAVGEGIGRLACISFGCCYGRRLDSCPPWLRGIFDGRAVIVVGPTRKAAYAGHCEGVPLLPVPACSACLLSSAGIVGVLLYLGGSLRAAALVSLGVAFLWRFASEFLRADDRGTGSLTAYQCMALVCLGFVIPCILLLPGPGSAPEIHRAAWLASAPSAWLALFGLGAAVFAYLGVSTVTASAIELTVCHQVGDGGPNRETQRRSDAVALM